MSGSIPVETWLASRFITPWGSDRVASQYSPELLDQIATHFSTLETAIKLKVLFSFLGVRKAQLRTCESGLRAILQRASADDDEWVRLLAEILASFPDNQTLCIDFSNEHYQQLITDISAKLKQTSSTFFPLESGYLAQPPPHIVTPSHFKLKKPLEPIIAKKAAPAKPAEPPKKEVHPVMRPPSPLRRPLGRSHDSGGPRLGMLAGMHLPPDKKRKGTAVLELDDLKEMQAQQKLQEDALKRKREEDPKNSAAEKMRKQLERAETIKSRQLEREEKKKKKQEEIAARKREIEERKAEKEAAKRGEKAPAEVPGLGPLVSSLATPAMRAEFNAITMLANASEAMTGIPAPIMLPRQSFVPATASASAPTPSALPLPVAALAPAPTPAPAPQPPVSVSALLEGNKISAEDREVVVKFLSGDRTNTTGNPIRQFILNEEAKQNPTGGFYSEQIVFEVNYSTGQWKKLRRKLKVVGEDGRDEAPKMPPAVQPQPAPPAAAEAKQPQ